MGKRRKSNRKPKAADNHDTDDELEKMPIPNPDTEDYFNDDIEKFSSKKDKILLDQNNEDGSSDDDYVEEDDEIMEVEDDNSDEDDKDDEEENEDFLADEDENDSEAGLPSRKAWGRKKKEFYDSNLKDAAHFENAEEEEMVAEEEEKEAMALQKRMASHLDQQDFDIFELEEKATYEDQDEVTMDEETQIAKDLSTLSKEEKIQILMKDSPELFVFLDDYQTKLSDVINKYHPLLLIARNGDIISQEGREFIEIMHQLLLNYCINISFYLSLKAKKENVKDHPVIEKLVRYRNLISKMEPVAKRLEDEMNSVLHNSATVDSSARKEQTTTSKNLKQLAKEAKSKKTIISTSESTSKDVIKKLKQNKSAKESSVQDPWEYYNSVASRAKEKKQEKMRSIEINDDEDEEDDEEGDLDGKRAITYEMAKNKGLTRKRKKESRNPRVKHKMKFKKAVVKRKSQVPLVRNEASNYGGEMTGISSRVSKSVKIK